MTMTKRVQLDTPESMELLPPWRRFPDIYASRDEFVESVLRSAEASSFLEGIPLSTPDERNQRRERVLAELRVLYPDT